jgi:TatD DNase family protein
MLVDSHCHLDYPDFTEEGVEAVVARAQAAGVGHFLTICTEISKFSGVRAVAEAFPFIHCTVGTHPHHAAEEIDVTAEQLIALSKHPKVAGIGETGLDYHYNHSPAAEQKKAFAEHIRAAVAEDLPLVVHTREADDDTIRVLREAGGLKARGVMHCFSGGQALAEKSLELGFFLSFSGIVTFKKADELREVVKTTPLSRILIETDSPYLAPLPHRGKRNEPAFVVHTADMVAELKGVTRDELAQVTTENFFKLFNRARPA